MRFKNYKNKYTNDNVIHSIEDVIGMPFGDVVNREPELESQYSQIGLPMDAELNSSPNAVYVNAYTRDDGTQVSAHWRSKPEGRVNGVNSNPISEQIQSGISVPTYPNGIYGLEHDIQDYQSDIPDYINNLPDESFAKAIINRIGVPSAQDGIFDGTFPSTLPQYGINSYGNTENPNPINDYTFQKSADFPYDETIPNYTDRLGNLLQGISNQSGINPVNNLPMSDYGYNNLQSFSNPQGQINTNIIQNSVDNQNDGEITHIFTPNHNPAFNPALSLLQGYVSETQPQIQQRPVQPKRENNQQVVPNVGNGQNEYIRPYKQTGLHPVDFTKSLGKGFLHGFSKIGMGLGYRYGNDIRQTFGKEPLNPYEIDNIYGKVLGFPQKEGAYKTGKLIGELLPFIILPEVNFVKFPIIANILLTNIYQAVIEGTVDSVSDKGISKELIPDVINRVTLALITALAMHGLLKNVDIYLLFENIQIKLAKIFNWLTENRPSLAIQSDGLLVLKHGFDSHETGEEFYERVMSNYRKKVKERANKREIVKKRLPNKQKEFIINGKTYKEIWLPEKEYNAVHSAFTTYIMHTNYSEPIIKKEYGDYVYTAFLEWIDGQPLPVFVGKKIIKGVKR